MKTNHQTLQAIKQSNQTKLQDQQQRESSAVRKLVAGNNLTGQQYIIIYNNHIEMYSIDSYGNIGDIKTINNTNINNEYLKVRGYKEA